MIAMTIALRELRERSRLFAICVALALLPFLATLLPGARNDRADVIGAVSSFLALAMALGSAAAFGGSTVMRDMAERRLSFYFSRPISAPALWIGKASASIFSSFACFAIIAFPSALVVGREWPVLWTMTAGELVTLTAAAVVVLFFLFHVLSSVIRSRSILIAVDFVMATILAGALVAIGRPLLIGEAIQLLEVLGIGIGAVILTILAVAPVWQLAHGRTELRRAHAALSRFLWVSISVVMVTVAAYVIWVVSATPSDLSLVVNLRQSPAREWVMAVGRGAAGRADYTASFLVDGKGTWRRLKMAPWSEMRFSRDGRVAAWFEPATFLPRNELELHTNRGPTGIRVKGYVEIALSDDGSRVALGHGPLVAVYDLAGGKLLASAGGFDRKFVHPMFFVSSDVLRVIEMTYSGVGGPLRIFEIDVPRKKVTKTADILLPTGAVLTASPDGSRILLRRVRRVIDGRTAATLQDLPKHETIAASVLDDGRIIETVREGERSRLRVRGGPEVLLPIAVASVAGQLADGTLIVRGTRQISFSHTGRDRAQFIVDIDRGVIVRTVPGIKSADGGWGTDPRMVRYHTPRLAGVDGEGKLVWWNPRTGRIERPGV